jgi:hypothetical protein
MGFDVPELDSAGFPLELDQFLPEVRVEDRLVLPREPIPPWPVELGGADAVNDKHRIRVHDDLPIRVLRNWSVLTRHESERLDASRQLHLVDRRP